MAHKRRASHKITNFDFSVSYLVNETRLRFKDALNVFSNQGKCETRFGISRLNATGLEGFDEEGESLGPSEIQSLSFFKSATGERFIIAKVGRCLYAVDSAGTAELIYFFCPPDTKHRGITVGKGASTRHIIALGSFFLYQFDGESFTDIGQIAPVAPTIATEESGELTDAEYRVGLTWYATSTGFESNLGDLSNAVTTSGQGLEVTGIPTVASNLTIDKVRIYLKKTASVDDPIFVDEVDLGTTTYIIDEDPVSTQVPPVGHDKFSYGAKYLLDFNKKVLAFGSDEFPNDIFFFEEYLPDAYNNGSAPGRQVLFIPGDGPVTAGAVGLYNNSVLDPYTVFFKDRSTHIYSEINGAPKFVTLSEQIGCVSHDTVRVKNGDVFFLSDQGWRVIRNGSFINDEKGNPITLGMGEIDDIFRSPGFTYEVNRSRLRDTFSVYYSALDQYITWVAEGARNDFSKAYVYENKVGGFKPYEFAISATSACVGEDGDGVETVFMSDASGFIYKHSTKEARQDVTAENEPVDITAFGLLSWFGGDDMDATFNYRNFLIRRLVGGFDMELKVWLNYTMDTERSYIIKGPVSGFVLDESEVDNVYFGQNDRSIISDVVDINSTCESIMFGFFQKGKGQNLGLVSAQIDYSKNRARR